MKAIPFHGYLEQADHSARFRTSVLASILIHVLLLGGSAILLSRPAEYGVAGAFATIAHRKTAVFLSREPVEFIAALSEDAPSEERKKAARPQPSKPASEESTASAGAYEIPAYYRNPAPPYPEEARQLKQEGEVLLRVEVDGDGKTTGVSMIKSSGFASLDEAAIGTVKCWKFKPARIAGIAIATHVIVPVSFRLKDVR